MQGLPQTKIQSGQGNFFSTRRHSGSPPWGGFRGVKAPPRGGTGGGRAGVRRGAPAGALPSGGGAGTSRSRSPLGLRAPPRPGEAERALLGPFLDRRSSAPMSGDALDASFVADAENLAPDTFSNLARLNGLVSDQIDGLSSSSSPNTKKRNLEELALLTTVVGNPQSAVTPQQHYHQGASSASSPVSLDTAQLRCESIWACHSCRQDRVSGLWFQDCWSSVAQTSSTRRTEQLRIQYL